MGLTCIPVPEGLGPQLVSVTPGKLRAKGNVRLKPLFNEVARLLRPSQDVEDGDSLSLFSFFMAELERFVQRASSLCS